MERFWIALLLVSSIDLHIWAVENESTPFRILTLLSALWAAYEMQPTKRNNDTE